MKYTYSYFRKMLPEWKRKKDPILSQLFYRPISLYIASWLANRKIGANSVSYFSIIIAFVASVLFLFDDLYLHVVAAVLVNIWLILDCVDGNLARTIKKQPFGDFADAVSSYVLVAMMCITMGVAVYYRGGVFLEKGCSWIIFIGAVASISDTLMRLVYQKYKSTERALIDLGKISPVVDKRNDEKEVRSFQVRIEAELGVGGILPFVILLCTCFNALDVVVWYCFFYYGMSSLFVIIMYVKKAITQTKIIESKEI